MTICAKVKFIFLTDTNLFHSVHREEISEAGQSFNIWI